MGEIIVHKRQIGNPNETLCGNDGAKIYLSIRVTCPECLRCMGSDSHKNASMPLPFQ